MNRLYPNVERKIFRYLVAVQDACPVLNEQIVRDTRLRVAGEFAITLEQLALIERRGLSGRWLEQMDKANERAAQAG